MRRGAKRTKARGKAKPPVTSKAQGNLEKRLTEALKREAEALELLRTRDRELAESQEQQTATSEILRVISSSPTDVQPVFDTILRDAVRLCGAIYGMIWRYDGEMVDLAGVYNFPPSEFEEVRSRFPRPVSESDAIHNAVRSGHVVDIPDVEDASHIRLVPIAAWRRRGVRSVVVVPMRREGEVIGAIGVSHREVGAFSPSRVELLRTFADQAVIAIENVRLFTETKEALDRQTATSEILRVISSSPTDARPVFEAIAENAVRLCNAMFSAVHSFDGTLLHFVAGHRLPREAQRLLQEQYPIPPRGLNRQAIIEGAVVHAVDVFSDPRAMNLELARTLGYRSNLVVPMLQAGQAIGTINVFGVEPTPFSNAQIELLKTFADQAVIAIENVRLFTELQEKNQALTRAHAQVSESLEQQTATAEILRVISSSPTDVQPVFDAIIRSAVRLLGGFSGLVTQIIGDQVHLAALTSTNPSGDAAQKALWPRPVKEDVSVHGQVITSLAPYFIADIESDPAAPPTELAVARARGWRNIVAVPLLREGQAVGSLAVTRREAGAFADGQVALLQTFADQAVIAIENVRLFKELQASNRDLTEALEQQTATSEILKVISRSPTDVQPVFDAIAESAARLCGAFDAVVYRVDGNVLRPVAHHGSLSFGAVGPLPLVPGTANGRAAIERRLVHVADLQAATDEFPEGAAISRQEGTRSFVSVPLLRTGGAMGTIAVRRFEIRPFTDDQIALLKTFADQAVIAIENVRLFKELEARTHDLTRSVGELQALGEIGQAISSTLDLQTVLSTIVARATQLSGTDAGVIYEYDEPREIFVPRATEHLETEIVETMLATPVRKGERATGRLAEVQEPIQVPDILEAPAESRVRSVLVRAGYRALLAVPLVREGQLLGGLTIIRKTTGAFAPDTTELLQTFATQSSLAIQNARLFHEIADKSRQLEVASQHKSEFLANMSHELRTPLNAIIGFSEVLAEGLFGEINAKQTEYLNDILESGRHLLSLINDILDLSKVEAGRMELEATDFDLPAAVENALILVRERATRRGILLGHTVDERLGTIHGDERKLKQVLLNLLSNALKFTPEGGRIDVRASVQGDMAEISVTDTGVGIAPEDQEAVFEEFRQVGTAAKKVEGTGLGLALSRKFIELHGGKIWVKSQVGQGSTFTFTLPVRRGA